MSPSREPFGAIALGVLLLSPAPVVLGCKRGDATPAPLRVAAASDLAFAFPEVAQAFEKQGGAKVSFSFGSTGLLAKQIEQGAPFDVFAAANVEFADEAVKEGACNGDTKRIYARGRVVMWTKEGSAPESIATLASPGIKKIAIANPEHAPYGKAAQQALEHAGVWGAIKPKLVYGENVQQTLQFAQTGNADVAIVALSLALVSGGAFTAIDPKEHADLDQALVVCKGEGAKSLRDGDARAFAAFVSSDAGRAIMRRFGFLLPGEAPPTTAALPR